MIIYLVQKIQITPISIKKILKSILAKYSDITNNFSKKLTIKLPNYLSINKYAINFKKSQQLFYQSIYNLKLLELKTLITYIKINLTNSFIQL